MKKSLLALALSLCLTSLASAYDLTTGADPVNNQLPVFTIQNGTFVSYAPTNSTEPQGLPFDVSTLHYDITVDITPNASNTYSIYDAGTVYSSGFLSNFNYTLNGTNANVSADVTQTAGTLPTNGYDVPVSLTGTYNGLNNTFQGTFSTQAVPEPSTWAMLGLGVAGTGVMVLRRRRVA